jgi:hypothetical protein
MRTHIHAAYTDFDRKLRSAASFTIRLLLPKGTSPWYPSTAVWERLKGIPDVLTGQALTVPVLEPLSPNR